MKGYLAIGQPARAQSKAMYDSNSEIVGSIKGGRERWASIIASLGEKICGAVFFATVRIVQSGSRGRGEGHWLTFHLADTRKLFCFCWVLHNEWHLIQQAKELIIAAYFHFPAFHPARP